MPRTVGRFSHRTLFVCEGSFNLLSMLHVRVYESAQHKSSKLLRKVDVAYGGESYEKNLL